MFSEFHTYNKAHNTIRIVNFAPAERGGERSMPPPAQPGFAQPSSSTAARLPPHRSRGGGGPNYTDKRNTSLLFHLVSQADRNGFGDKMDYQEVCGTLRLFRLENGAGGEEREGERTHVLL